MLSYLQCVTYPFALKYCSMLLNKKSPLLDLPDGLLREIVWQLEADDHLRKLHGCLTWSC